MVQVQNFTFGLSGLSITYTLGNSAKTLSYDALATCDLLVQLKAIEGFDIDKNGEPVILFTENIGGRITTGFCLWCDFVRTFGFIQRHAELIVESKQDSRLFRKQDAIITALLSPLGAA